MHILVNCGKGWRDIISCEGSISRIWFSLFAWYPRGVRLRGVGVLCCRCFRSGSERSCPKIRVCGGTGLLCWSTCPRFPPLLDLDAVRPAPYRILWGSVMVDALESWSSARAIVSAVEVFSSGSNFVSFPVISWLFYKWDPFSSLFFLVGGLVSNRGFKNDPTFCDSCHGELWPHHQILGG